MLSQCLNIFLLQSVTLRSYKYLAGIEKTETDGLRLSSFKYNHRYSEADCVLLRWFNYHISKSTGRTSNITNFEIHDCSLFMHLIKNHIPDLVNDPQEDLQTNPNTLFKTLVTLFPYSNCLKTFPVNKLEDISSSIGLEIFLLVLFLYQNLHQFIRKTTIKFEGPLHSTTQRKLDILNPSHLPISYHTNLNPLSNFKIFDEKNSIGSTINIPPKSSLLLTVEFSSRFSGDIVENVLLKSTTSAIGLSSILNFEFSGHVTVCKPDKMIKIESPMYFVSAKALDLNVLNPFNLDASFKIRIVENASTNLPFFYINAQKLNLKANEDATLPFTFIPLELKTYSAMIHFLDEKVGEFYYQIEGKTLEPQVSEILNWSCRSTGVYEKSLHLTHSNNLRDKAIMFALNSSGNSESNMELSKYSFPSIPLKYKVEYSSPLFKGPSEITIQPNKVLKVPKRITNTFTVDRDDTELPISLCPKKPGKYSCTVTLTSIDGTDIRVFQINATAISNGSSAELDFTTHARTILTQELPFVNKTKDEWTIKAMFQGSGFNGPQSITVPSNGTVNYPVSFNPSKACDMKSVLVLTNSQTTQKHVYSLRGIGLESLPEEKYTINCCARELTTKTKTVKNYSPVDSEFIATSSLPGFKSKTFTVKGAESYAFEAKFTALVSGKFTNEIHFTNQSDGSSQWFVIELIVSPPAKEKTLFMYAQVRKTSLLELKLLNPLDTLITYKVMIEGAGLKGESVVMVNPKSDILYNLVFEPRMCIFNLVVSQVSKGSIKFINERIGEFWYEIELEGTECPPINLQKMKCPIGKYVCQTLKVSNPLDKEILFDIFITNSRDFRIVSANEEMLYERPQSISKLVLSALEEIDLNLYFWPSSLQEQREAKIQFACKETGTILYNVEGSGSSPEMMPEVFATSKINEMASCVFTFNNPFVDPITVIVALDDSNNKDSEFRMINTRRTKFMLNGQERLEIPFTYTPKTILETHSRITVFMTKDIIWEYPVRGVPFTTIYSSTGDIIKARVREVTKQDVVLNLEGIVTDGENRSWITDLILKIDPKVADARLEERIAEEVKVAISEVIAEESLKIKFIVEYAPKVSGEYGLKLTLSDRKGIIGNYQTILKCVGLPQAVADIITVDGTTGKISNVSFDLKYTSEVESKFKVQLTGSGELDFNPKQGTLSPVVNGKSNIFTVKYKPISGKIASGNVLISCADKSWSFDLKGVPTIKKKR